MSGAMFVHTKSMIQCRIQGHEFLGQPEKAETLKQLMRKINRGHINTLTGVRRELERINKNENT